MIFLWYFIHILNNFMTDLLSLTLEYYADCINILKKKTAQDISFFKLYLLILQYYLCYVRLRVTGRLIMIGIQAKACDVTWRMVTSFLFRISLSSSIHLLLSGYPLSDSWSWSDFSVVWFRWGVWPELVLIRQLQQFFHRPSIYHRAGADSMQDVVFSVSYLLLSSRNSLRKWVFSSTHF